GGELRFCLRAEPKTLNPILAADDSSETIRYLTGGVLMRFGRRMQEIQPELAESWKVSEGGRKISFKLREGVKFSDGTPFTAEDVAFTMGALMDPNLHSPTGDSFRSAEGAVKVDVTGPHSVLIVFPAPVAGLERLFDQVAILSARSPKKEMAGLGPFYVAEHKAGSYILLRRNPYYWKRDAEGKQLPYLDSIRLDIQQNRDVELLRFRRGEVHLINSLDAEGFDRLAGEMPSAARDAGPSLDSEQIWFNQVGSAPIPAYKKAWFRSQGFRRAISEAINREDICRVVFGQHARPGVGPVSPANRFWFNNSLHAQAFDPPSALRRLSQEGFHLEGNILRDREGYPVEFSLVTNAGNKSRERMATMIQQDLSQIGIRLNVVTLDFPSLIERITRTFDYEACLLGLVNDDLDPSAQMNVWLSSASNHQWNPNQKSPETPWEAEIDRLMRAQASTTDNKKRKEYFDKVQQIAWEEVPFIYVVNRNALSAVAPQLANVTPGALRPQTYWNVEKIHFAPQKSGGSR
ncbi:MAG TPA: ABC transporter substrate-binding protein, partial [Candidatus Acidoferrales bacterium]|nr:ABC transporter substrate-binding protein [Candidatus Acidoferrales bacterium]